MLEVCIDSIESAISSEEGGASRIELCSALSEGGLTPTPGMLKTIKNDLKIKIPIYCMLRPRRGNDFHYSEAEMQSILYDLEILKSCGSDGLVFGSLDDNQNINEEQCKMIIQKAGNLPVTFHRAFDMTNKEQMHKNCDLIEQLGFKRILSSGFEQTAEKGLDNLKELIEKHRNICIMPGSGISTRNLDLILRETGCKEFHASARSKKYTQKELANISMGSGDVDAESLLVTNVQIVKELVEIAKAFQ